MKLTILGSSSALPTSERFPSAHALDVHERIYLIDCGEGTQLQLRRNRIRFSKINHIFISHLHGDHVFGIYGLLSTMNLMGRKTPLNIFAPGNYDAILSSHLRDFDLDLGFEIQYTSLKGKDPEVILDNKHLTVTSFPLVHRIPSFGFLFREKPKERNIIKECIEKYNIPISSIQAIKKGEDFETSDGKIIKNDILTLPPAPPVSYAYCSDTKYFSKLASFVKGVTVIYHEATFSSENQKLAKTTFHSTTLDAAVTAKNAETQSLIIGHFSSRYKNINPLVDEARTIFPRTFPAIDGKSYEIVSDNIEY